MSLEIVRHVNQQHPTLLQENVNRTCYQFIVLVIAALRSAGHQAYHVCKSPGEGQYTPPGFAERQVTGLDGNVYRCSGVSHDAIWCDGKQFDTIARGNDSPDPIQHPDGAHMTGLPVWNEIPQHHWRPNNPPLKDSASTSPIHPPSGVTMPDYEALGGDAYFRINIGKPLQDDMREAGQTLNDGSSVWFSRPIFRILHAYASGQIPDKTAIIKSVRNEWRAILGLPPLP